MPAYVSLPLIAALLLNNIVVAQHIGLRRINSLREACGVGAIIGTALIITAATAWPLRVFVLIPLQVDFLYPFISVITLALATQIVEQIFRAHQSQLFPLNGNHLPLAISNGIILWLTLNISASTFLVVFGRAVLAGLSATLLLIAFQALRERTAQVEVPEVMRGAATDMLLAGFVVTALCGIVGIMQ
jgi:Na+-translocating ferredoxin:NAD+ oxidoreductase RnfA subunit